MPALFSAIFQFVALGLAALAIGGLYLASHHLGHTAYFQSVSGLVSASLQTYQLALDPQTNEVRLTQAGQPIASVENLSPGPFALEKFASFQGTLAKYQAVAATINGAYARHHDAVMSVLRPDPSRPFFYAPLAHFGVTGSDAGKRLTHAERERLNALRSETFRTAARTLLLSAPTFDPHATATMDFDSGDRAPKAYSAFLREVRLGVDEFVRGGTVSAPVGTDDAIRAYFQHAFEQISRATLESTERSVVPQGTEAHSLLGLLPPRPRAEATDLNALLSHLNERLRYELLLVVHGETSALWLMGRFRWFEIVFWVWFGVLTKALIDQGMILVGANRVVFQPREILRIFAKLFYAPLLALALFFLASFIGAANEAVELGRSSAAALGMAFVLGLFPNTAFRLLREVSTKLFREDLSTREKTQSPLPVRKPVVTDASHRAQGAVYRLDQLQRNVAAHVTGPLQR